MKAMEVINNDSAKKLSKNSLVNLFNVAAKDGHYVLLCNKTITVIGSDSAYQELYDDYVWSINDEWATLSSRFYSTPNLWWVICKFNEVTNPLILPEIGEHIKIPKQTTVDYILDQIKNA